MIAGPDNLLPLQKSTNMKLNKNLAILLSITALVLIFAYHTAKVVGPYWAQPTEDPSPFQKLLGFHIWHIHFIDEEIIKAVPFAICFFIGSKKHLTTWTTVGWLLFVFWLLSFISNQIIFPSGYHSALAQVIGKLELTQNMDYFQKAAIYVFIIYWWFFKKGPVLNDKLFRDRKVSNTFITIVWIIGNVWLTTKLLLPYTMLILGNIPFYIGTILAYAVAIIGGYLFLNYKVFTLPLVFRCPQCHGFENTTYEGEFYDGVKAKKDYSHHSVEDTEVLDVSQMIIKTTTTTHKHYNYTRYYEVLADVYVCGECGARWKRTHDGQFLGQDVKTKKETEKTTLKW